MFVWRLLLAAALVAVVLLRRASADDCGCVAPVRVVAVASQPKSDSWVFMRSRYTHDPETGARVAQYSMKPAIEPLDDPRLVTSGYSRSRVVLRGADGSADTHYRVQSYGNGRGGLDAEWERFHDAWRGSTIAGGQYQGFYAPNYGYGYGGYGGYGGPGYGYGGGYGPGFGYGGAPGFLNNGFGRGFGYGPGFGQPDAGLLDPDAADGYQEQRRRTPNRQFFTPALPPFRDLYQQHDGHGSAPSPGHGQNDGHGHGPGHGDDH
jgi:hypothetical protein